MSFHSENVRIYYPPTLGVLLSPAWNLDAPIFKQHSNFNHSKKKKKWTKKKNNDHIWRLQANTPVPTLQKNWASCSTDAGRQLGKKSQFPFRGKGLLSHLAHRASSQGRRWSAKISRHMFNWQNLSLFLTVFGHLCLPSSLAPVLVSTRAPARWLSSKSAMTYAETDFFYTMELYIAEQLQTSNVYFQWTEGDSCVLCSYSATTRLFSWFFRSRATPYLSGPQWRSLLNQIGFPTFILLSFLGVGLGRRGVSRTALIASWELKCATDLVDVKTRFLAYILQMVY